MCEVESRKEILYTAYINAHFAVYGHLCSVVHSHWSRNVEARLSLV